MSPELAFRLPEQRERIFAEVERLVRGAQERLRLLRLADEVDHRLFDRFRAAMHKRAKRRPAEARV